MNDGFSFSNIVFTLSAEKVSETPLFSVIRPKLVKRNRQNDKLIVVILDFDIIYDNIQEIIGAPIDYKEYLRTNRINIDGNTSIPFKYLNLNENDRENNDFVFEKKEEVQSNDMDDERKIHNFSQKYLHVNENYQKNNDFICEKKEEFESNDIENEQKIEELSQKTAHFFETPLKIPKKDEKVIRNEKIHEKNPTIEKTIENHRKTFLDKFKVIFTLFDFFI